MLAAVFDDALVLLSPDFFKQRPFGGDIRVGVENQHLAAWLDRLEVAGNHRCPLVRPRRAAIRRFRDGDGVHAAIRHGFKLFAQCNGLGPALPRLQNLAGYVGLLQAFNTAKHQLDTG